MRRSRYDAFVSPPPTWRKLLRWQCCTVMTLGLFFIGDDRTWHRNFSNCLCKSTLRLGGLAERLVLKDERTESDPASIEGIRSEEHKKRLTNTLRRLIQPAVLMWCRRVPQIRAVTALLSAFVAVQAVGQAATSTLRGRVSDTRGHTVGGAQVLLYIETSSEARPTAVSDHLGQFEFSHLAPASDYR